MNILVTGGAGYIGSHTCVELLNQGHKITVLDNLSNSSYAALERVQTITNAALDFVEGDIRDFEVLENIFKIRNFGMVIHFAGLKAVGESVENPVSYYEVNLIGTLNLLKVMSDHGVKSIIFSSSATVYGNPQNFPILETAPRNATNPYGKSKLMVEHMLEDIYVSDPTWRIACLRYFNPVGAHPSGLIGESPHGIPNNLMPFISQVASGRRESLSVFGTDYQTHDGTGVRDYIHVVDVAKGHLAALCYLDKHVDGHFLTVNLGRGQGFSVLDMLNAFETASGKTIKWQPAPRRSGDIDSCYADVTLANEKLGWKADLGISEMCADTWRWQSNNPNGYQ